ncbi:putative N-acetyltransferase san-like protein [Dinothrombium tinctorium]|uniref:N-terminal methionine N(alpha)-acetyltransferase NatE n=1 Tax=Dinothrombium tinctorium TaxID=1965070 RepID=A0A443QMF6_9ACAR|nr:putative N-acetyltransferase san-like protein [Dinothrombium tinctorium]RWS04224.1 putative N-acetyltransferase san-like protein [Dinothrombium tinctorium]RWS16407.1 putative N-acetyltransferase san-like protein [Dinothrombium tinctorium]
MAVSSIAQLPKANENFKSDDENDYYYNKAKPKRIGGIELGDVTPHNIKLLRKLNQVVFPVTYNDKFYKDVLEAGELAKLAYYNDIVVGAVCCRIDNSENMRRLYIMTLGCLAPYRRLGIGTKMLLHVLEYAKNHRKFDAIFLHVQINNESAINFYKKFGFEIVETKQNYYKRIEPADAHVLQKTLHSCNANDEE